MATQFRHVDRADRDPEIEALKSQFRSQAKRIESHISGPWLNPDPRYPAEPTHNSQATAMRISWRPNSHSGTKQSSSSSIVRLLLPHEARSSWLQQCMLPRLGFKGTTNRALEQQLMSSQTISTSCDGV